MMGGVAGIFTTSATAGAGAGGLLPSLLRRQPRSTLSFYSVSASASASAASSYSRLAADHMTFIKEVAATRPPENLSCLLNIVLARGDSIVSPGAKHGMIPLAIPLSENESGTITALLRWPTAPPGMDMPVVEVHRHGVWWLAKTVDQYIHRLLAEEDAAKTGIDSSKLTETSSRIAESLFKSGDFKASQYPSLDVYLLKKVGLFPDILERKVKEHLEKEDFVSAMVTCEFYAKGHFPGFARPFVYNAEILQKVGRKGEAKDAARVALKSPWWTLGCQYNEVAKIAEWEDEQVEYIKERVTEEGKLVDLKKGKEPAQVALDEAAFLLDLASVEGTWSDVVEQVADNYKEAGLDDIARFILYGD